MRLIQYDAQGNYSLVEHNDDHIPRYAILSHTWGADGAELTFDDLMEGTGKNKAGYNKIEFCRKQTTSDGLQHFWVDTCCIDKSSSAELSEAIYSMFRWYHHAAKCYVYLSDVSTNDDSQNSLSFPLWEAAFRNSRWFTRGWTLQELIAPPLVEFFSFEGNLLGDKKSLERQIHEVTGVAVGALRGSALSDYSVAERMSWAEEREIKRGEDKAYSLLGIFDICIPLMYGVGMKKALRQLQEEIVSAQRTWQLPQPSPSLSAIIAGIPGEQGKNETALKRYGETFEVTKNTRGNRDTMTLEAACRVARKLKRQGRHETALKWYKEILEVRKEVLGHRHLETLEAAYSVAEILELQGRNEVALKWYKEILEVRKEALGDDQTETLRTAMSVERVLENMKRSTGVLR